MRATAAIGMVALAGSLAAVPSGTVGAAVAHAGAALEVTATRTWKTVGYGGVAISVPRPWGVEFDDPCPPGDSVTLGKPAGTFYCPFVSGSTTTVTFTPVPVGGDAAGERVPPLHIRGLTVYPQTSGSATLWVVPSVGIEVAATGPLATSLLRTLRPLT